MVAGAGFPALATAQMSSRQAQQDKEIQAAVTAQLDKKELFRAVKAEVNEGIVTISGEVPLYIDKTERGKTRAQGQGCRWRAQSR